MVGSRGLSGGGWLENGPRSEPRGDVFPTHLNDLSISGNGVMRRHPSRSYISKAQLSFCSEATAGR